MLGWTARVVLERLPAMLQRGQRRGRKPRRTAASTHVYRGGAAPASDSEGLNTTGQSGALTAQSRSSHDPVALPSDHRGLAPLPDGAPAPGGAGVHGVTWGGRASGSTREPELLSCRREVSSPSRRGVRFRRGPPHPQRRGPARTPPRPRAGCKRLASDLPFRLPGARGPSGWPRRPLRWRDRRESRSAPRHRPAPRRHRLAGHRPRPDATHHPGRSSVSSSTTVTPGRTGSMEGSLCEARSCADARRKPSRAAGPSGAGPGPGS